VSPAGPAPTTSNWRMGFGSDGMGALTSLKACGMARTLNPNRAEENPPASRRTYIPIPWRVRPRVGCQETQFPCVDNSNTRASLLCMPTATANLHLRITPRNKRLLQQAASVSHASNLTDYVIRSALRQAKLDLLERETFVLKDKDWESFNRLLEAPARVVPALKKLAATADVFRRTAQ
jgi:uncharacterized protein (DUF1778 family)